MRLGRSTDKRYSEYQLIQATIEVLVDAIEASGPFGLKEWIATSPGPAASRGYMKLGIVESLHHGPAPHSVHTTLILLHHLDYLSRYSSKVHTYDLYSVKLNKSFY